MFQLYRLAAPILWLGFIAAICRSQDATRMQPCVIDGIEFEVREGWTLSKVATAPLVRWPIVADWDTSGRLVVAESGGVSWPIQQHNEQKLHRIVRLVDRDGDGDFDDRIVAADQLAFPEGVLCLGNDIFVAAPPVIWRLSDNDADGVCEQREIWFDGETVTNCANDLHGPYLGRDGWIYWCKGAFGEQTHELDDGRSTTSSAAHIYRRRPEGGRLDRVISGGMDNPVEVAITPEGDKFFTSTFLQHPADGKRDGIGHAIYGAVFGKDHRVVDPLWKTGPLMTPMTHLGPAAPSGLICLESPDARRKLGLDEGARVLAAALFNLHKVTIHQLEPLGATYRSIDSDLVRTERVDVHPTDVIEAPDGSLLMVDTGGWYDLCCPTSRVDQKTADGGIYRISPIATNQQPALAAFENDSPPVDPSDVETAVLELFDARSWVRRTAAERVAMLGDDVIPSLKRNAGDSSRALEHRQEAIWALCRLESPAADAVVANLLESSPIPMQLTCLQVLGLHRHAASRNLVEPMLNSESPAIRRAAATALGRMGDWQSAQALMQAVDSHQGDRHEQHARRYALMEIAWRHPDRSINEFADSDATLNVALLVHRQLQQPVDIDPMRLFAALRSDNAELSATATAVLCEQSQYAAQSEDELNSMWRRLGNGDATVSETLGQLLESWREQSLVADRIARGYESASSLAPTQQDFLARNVNRITPQPLSAQTLRPILAWSQQATDDVRRSLLPSLARARCDEEAGELLANFAVDQANRAPSMTETLNWLAIVPGGSTIDQPSLELAIVQALLAAPVDSADDSMVAAAMTDQAATALTRIRLSSEPALSLASSLDRLAPKHLSVAIEATARSASPDVVDAMLKSLSESPAARMLPAGYLVNLFRQSPSSVRQRVQQLADKLEQPSADVSSTVQQVLSELKPGDPVRGLQVFRSSKAACSACHRMGYIGKNIGPELTRIGGSRTREALLEAILFPSSRIEQSYQSTQLLTTDGRIFRGLVRSRSNDGIEIQIEADRVIQLDRESIESERPTDVSVMPSGLIQVLSRQDLADLLSLLESAR
jgi:putative membrane-bound dehydrogenase-like protein